MYFVGIDLAWKMSDSPSSGVPRSACVALGQAGHICSAALVYTDEEILSFITQFAKEELLVRGWRWLLGAFPSFVARFAKEGLLVGIDAPLRVPVQQPRRRKAERILAKLGMPAFTPNPAWLKRIFGGIRGEVLVEKLRQLGILYQVRVNKEKPCQVVSEVYPTATLKVLYWEHSQGWTGELLEEDRFWKKFRKISIPPYKGRCTLEAKAENLKSNLALMEEIPGPRLRVRDLLSSFSGAENWPQNREEIGAHLGHTRLNQLGDLLDATLAAYTVWRYWHLGEVKSCIVGTGEDGFVLLPCDRNLKRRIELVTEEVERQSGYLC